MNCLKSHSFNLVYSDYDGLTRMLQIIFGLSCTLFSAFVVSDGPSDMWPSSCQSEGCSDAARSCLLCVWCSQAWSLPKGCADVWLEDDNVDLQWRQEKFAKVNERSPCFFFLPSTLTLLTRRAIYLQTAAWNFCQVLELTSRKLPSKIIMIVCLWFDDCCLQLFSLEIIILVSYLSRFL